MGLFGGSRFSVQHGETGGNRRPSSTAPPLDQSANLAHGGWRVQAQAQPQQATLQMKMKNQNGEPNMIKEMGIFHTPETWDELMKWVHSHSAEDRAHLVTAIGMAWNLACKEANDDTD